MHLLIPYILLFIGIFFEGELILLSAVIAAHQGYLDIWIVVIIAISATIISDLFYFNLGKYKAEKWLINNQFASKFDDVNQRLKKNRIKLLLFYRFIYGMRIITPFVLGTQKIKLIQFLKYSILTTIIWCLLFVGIGYAFGEIILAKLEHFEKIELYIIGSLILGSILFMIFKFFKRNAPRKTP